TEPVEDPTGQAPEALPADPAAGSAPRSRTGTAGRLGEDEVRDILTRAVAVSAAAVLMPQAGQIPENWRDLRARVLTEDATTKRSGKPCRHSRTCSTRFGKSGYLRATSN
ncbi:hypothetical protein KCW65_22785, partial [Mycobacterium tuberculosis]|nr:hypothetical protein [Mycobacterium tuberculosis]